MSSDKQNKYGFQVSEYSHHVCHFVPNLYSPFLFWEQGKIDTEAEAVCKNNEVEKNQQTYIEKCKIRNREKLKD